MKKFILGLMAAAAMLIVPQAAPAVQATGGTGNAEIHAVYVSCAAPDGSYTVVWVATITDLNRRGPTPTIWSIDGFVRPVTAPIGIVTQHNRLPNGSPVQEPRIVRQAVIGFSHPMLANSAYVPGFCI